MTAQVNPTVVEKNPDIERAVDKMWITRQSLQTPENALLPGCGWLPKSWMPEPALRQALRSVSRNNVSSLVDYCNPFGHIELRRTILRRLTDLGIEANLNEIMLVDSSSQALDLVCRCLLIQGDRVLVDDPCYFNFQASLAGNGAVVISVPYTNDGPDIEAFSEQVSRYEPNFMLPTAPFITRLEYPCHESERGRSLNCASSMTCVF